MDATTEQIRRAKKEYETDEIEIDDNAIVSEAEEGVWISAWVWLEHKEEEKQS